MSYYEKKRLQELADKYKIPDGSLEIEGMPRKKREVTVDDFVKDREREMNKGQKLAFATTWFRESPMRVWYNIKY